MGKLMTARLRDAGWTVAAADLAGSKLDAVAAESAAAPHPCDVSDDNQVTATAPAILDWFGRIDRPINAAASRSRAA